MAVETFLGHTGQTFPAGTRPAVDAANAIGVEVGADVKSLSSASVTTRAARRGLRLNRVDERKLEALAGQPVGKADADFVRAQTGFAIGGVPPAGHARRIETLIDEDLLALDELWAAAGTPRDVFSLTPAELVAMTGGRVADVAQR